MKNKKTKKLLVLIMLISLNILVAQYKNGCATEASETTKRFTTTELNNSKFATNNIQYVFNVKTHFVTNLIPIADQELKALDIVASLNYSFNPGNIFFKYTGYDVIDNPGSIYSTINDSNIFQFAMANNTNENIDIFIIDQLGNGSYIGQSYSTFTNNGSGQMEKKIIFVTKETIPNFSTTQPTPADLSNYSIAHEVGHYLGLVHTHQLWRYVSGYGVLPVSDSYTGCDIIEESLDGSQSNLYGDLIQDTNPDRERKRYWGNNNNYFNNCTINTGNYVGNIYGCGNSINFSLFNPPMSNIMSYYHGCSNSLTNGQFEYMRAYVTNHSVNGDFLQNELNTVESLYKPFDENQVIGNVISVTDDVIGDGMANVCRSIDGIRYHFQKGFTYTFLNIYNGSIITTNTIAETPSITTSFVQGININQISTSNVLNFGPVCLRGFHCELEPYIGGKIISTNLLGSNILTTQVLDSQQVVNPNLEQELPIQTYNIITKETSSGAVNQKTIYKNN